MNDHLIALAGGDWSLWRWARLRGAGFPVSLAKRLAAPEAARAVDELLDAEAAQEAARAPVLTLLRAELGAAPEVLQRLRRARKHLTQGKVPDPADLVDVAAGAAELAALREATSRLEGARLAMPLGFAEGRLRSGRAIREIALDPAFREAVTWQNRRACETVFAALAESPPSADAGKRLRQHEELVANYVHRYATKNDTIGFFGPSGFMRIEPDAPKIVVKPGPTLLAKRGTYFEQWAIDALAERLSADARVWPWLAPHRFGFLRFEGSTVHSPVTGKHALARAQELVLRACDGEKTIRELATELTREHLADLPTDDDVHRTVKELIEKKLVAASLVFRTTWRPERALRARIERIGDAALREELLRPLTELEAARAAVAAAAGDPAALAKALTLLDETFQRITGTEATRNAGAMYASRSVVFEDCRRDVAMTIGPELLREIGPALRLVLASARYLTYAAARAYEVAYRELHATMARKSGSRTVPFSEFWFRAQRLTSGTMGRPIDRVAQEVQEKWGQILAISGDEQRVQRSSDELSAAVAAAFDAPRAGWSGARYHAPDVMLAAQSVEAIERGDYLAVLGEVHVAINTSDYSAVLEQHPAPGELAAAVARDIPEPRVFTVVSKDSPRMSAVRGGRAISTPNDYELETGFDTSSLPRDRALRLGELVLEDDGERLVVVGRDGELRIDLLELVGSTTLGRDTTVNALDFLPDMPHSPRITIDRFVMRRESWRFNPDDLPFAFGATEIERFVGAKRWARARGLPRSIYVRSSLEIKPIYVDFDSPLAVNILSKIVRAAKEHVSGTAYLKVSEMLPTLEESWLPDAAGNRYTAELRVVAVDGSR